MIERKVHKDIREYQTKVVGPFTFRQIICGVAAGALDLLIYAFILKPLHIPMDYIVYVLIFIDVPILCFTLRPMGMKMEEYLKFVVSGTFVKPSKRKAYNQIIKRVDTQPDKKSKKTDQKKINKEHPELKPYV